MITISSKLHYGVVALFELAKHYNEGPVQIRAISDAHDIPQKYLEQVLVLLKQAGFLKSFRGSQGGYSLSQDPQEINMLDIWRCLAGAGNIPNDARESVLGFYWQELHSSFSSLLQLSLAQLIEKQLQQSNLVMYSI